MNDKRRIVIVLGMSRSGTSVITRGLKSLGIELGDKLLLPGQDNPTGYWEDAQIMNLNDDFLRANAYSWHTLRNIDWSSVTGQEDFCVRMKALLDQRVSDTVLWGFKDPRTYLLLPLWEKFLTEMEVQPLYVIPLRNPKAIAASLAVRNGFAPELTYYLWLQSMILVLRGTHGQRRSLLSYEQVLVNPEPEYRRVAGDLGLEIPVNFDEHMQAFREKFLSTELNHADVGVGESLRDSQVPKSVSALYSLFEKVAAGEITLDDHTIVKSSESIAADFPPPPMEAILKLLDMERITIERVKLKHSELEERGQQLEVLLAQTQALLAQEQEARHRFQGEYLRLEASLGYRLGEKVKKTINRYPRIKGILSGALKKAL